MPDIFTLLSEYFWVVALAFTAFNYWRAARGFQARVAPGRLDQGRSYLRIFGAAAAAPWILAGAGQLSGATPTVWHYLRPQDGNLFVLGWLAIILALVLVFAWWVFLRDGARKVVEFNLMATLGHQGYAPPSERMVKLFAALGIVIFPVWVALVLFFDMPLPR